MNKISIAKLASNKGIFGSTFNDWIIKYKRYSKAFSNVSNEIIKLEEYVKYAIENVGHKEEGDILPWSISLPKEVKIPKDLS